MVKLGITGGVGAGKSAILDYLEHRYNAKICKADELAHTLEEPGHDCYNKLVEAFGKQILKSDGFIDPAAFANIIFSSKDNLDKVNGIVHPAVKEYIVADMKRLEESGCELYVLEAALLVECGYKSLLDEIWYIYVSSDNRRTRLKAQRGYSDQKIDGIFASQMTSDSFRKSCDRTVDNNGSLAQTTAIIDDYIKSIGVS